MGRYRILTVIELSNGMPARDTFWRVFPLIDARNFQDAFDKPNRKSPIHAAGARATANGAALGQVKTDDRSNEITASRP